MPVKATEQLPDERVQVVGLNRTEPTPLWDQVTVPVGEEPVTFALHVMIVDEPATADFGVQETVVVVALTVTTRVLDVPEDAEFWESPK